MMIPKLASYILYFGAGFIVAPGIIRYTLGSLELIDFLMILGIAGCMAFIGADSYKRNLSI